MPIIPAQNTIKTTEETIKTIGGLVSTGLAASGVGAPYAALTAMATVLLSKAPNIYLDVMLWLANPQRTEEQKKALHAALVEMSNPEELYKDPTI